MKWFQHLSTAYSDIKIQDLLDEFGAEGYGIFWICCELVASQGNGFRIMSGQNWTKRVGLIAKLNEKKTSTIITFMADVGLIDKKSLNRGILSIPNLYKYADETTKKVRRVVGQSPDNVRQPLLINKLNIKNILISERIRTDIKIIYLYAYHKGITELSIEQRDSYIKRNIRYAQLLKGYPTLRVGEVMEWLNKNAEFKWTLESVGKYIDEDLKKLEKGEEVVKI